MKIVEVKVADGTEIDVKRFYLAASYTIECPVCKTKMVDDFGSNYLSYPVIGGMEDRYLVCGNCDSEFEFKIKLKHMYLTLEVDESKLKKVN